MKHLETFQADWESDHDAPISSAVRAGDYLWVAGMVPVNDVGEVVGVGDIQAQARQVFANIQHVLNMAGCDLNSVIRLTNYFATPLDRETAESYWEVRREVFGDHRPASTGLQVVGLTDPKIMLEIDTVAYAPTTPA